MEKRDIFFLLTFIISLGAIFYFLGNSITGYAVHEKYCENGVCKEFCKSNFDCKEKEICCDKGNFGVCEISSECKETSEISLKLDGKILHLESLNQLKESDMALLIIGMVILGLGIIYIFGKARYGET